MSRSRGPRQPEVIKAGTFKPFHAVLGPVVEREKIEARIARVVATYKPFASRMGAVAADRMQLPPTATAPVDMLLYCPACLDQHIDAPKGDWTNPPHKTRQCQNPKCRHLWRPSDYPTNGVSKIKTSGQEGPDSCNPSAM